jgi:hypothetical protein
MSTWKRIAIETFPPGREISRLIAGAKTPAYLWADLWPLLGRSRDHSLLASAFAYAAWCLAQANPPVQVMTLDGFYARIAEHAGMWTAAAQYLSRQDIAQLQAVWQSGAPRQYLNLMQTLQTTWTEMEAGAIAPLDAISPGQVAAIEKAIAAQGDPWIADCPNCTQLQDFHGADLRDGERLPDAAYRLKKAEDLTQDGIVHSQFLTSTGEILRCPLCGQFFDYNYDYEYGPCGGTSESEWIKRIPRAETLGWCRRFPLQHIASELRSAD